MAQKVNPVAVRLYLNRSFNSSWFSDYYYTQLLSQDYFLRNYFQKIHSSIQLRSYAPNVLDIKNKSLDLQNFGLRIGQCIIHRYSKKVILHIFYLLPNYRLFRNTSQLGMFPNLVNNLVFNGSKNLFGFEEIAKRSFASSSKQGSKMPRLFLSEHGYLPVNISVSLLSDIVLLMNTTFPFQLQNLNIALDVPKERTTLGIFNDKPSDRSFVTPFEIFRRASKRTGSANADVCNEINSPLEMSRMNETAVELTGLVSKPSYLSLQQQIWLRSALGSNSVDKNKFGILVQSWINLHWFILRYLFLHKYLINTYNNQPFLSLVNFVNLLKNNHRKLNDKISFGTSEAVHDELFLRARSYRRVLLLAPGSSRSRLLIPCVKTFQHSKIKTIHISKKLKVRESYDTRIKNALTRKLSNEKIDSWQTLTSHLSLKTSNYVYCVPVRSTSIFQSASLLAEEICLQLIQKQSFVKVWKNIFRFLNKQKPPMIKGLRISCSGRLNGAEIAKTENRQWGETSLHVFENKIDYAMQHALSPYGILGIKVWISYSE